MLVFGSVLKIYCINNEAGDNPRCSTPCMEYHGTGMFAYIWHRLRVIVGKYSIHGSYGNVCYFPQLAGCRQFYQFDAATAYFSEGRQCFSMMTWVAKKLPSMSDKRILQVICLSSRLFHNPYIGETILDGHI